MNSSSLPRTLIVSASAALLGAALLSGCGGGSSTPQVASIPTPNTSASTSTGNSTGIPAGGQSPASPGSSTSKVPGQRPVFRLDDTDARRTALINAWSQCLIDHGATRGTSRNEPGEVGPGTSDLIQVADPVPAGASAACTNLLPELPPETEAETNPDFHAQSLAYVACMKNKGLWVQLLNNHDLDWTFTAGHPVPDNQDDIEHGCLLQAFGGK